MWAFWSIRPLRRMVYGGWRMDHIPYTALNHSQNSPNCPRIRYFCPQSLFMEVNDALIEHLCKLANLEFDETGKQEIKKDLEKMIGFVEQLNAMDVSGVEPLLYMGEETNVLREDILEIPLNRSEALKNAPLADDQYFKVPRVVKKFSA